MLNQYKVKRDYFFIELFENQLVTRKNKILYEHLSTQEKLHSFKAVNRQHECQNLSMKQLQSNM